MPYMNAILKCLGLRCLSQSVNSKTLEIAFTHSASVQLYFEWFWFRCWRRLDFQPVLTAFHSLLTLLIQAIEGQYLQDTHKHSLNKKFIHIHPFNSHKETSKHPRNLCLPSQTLSQFAAELCDEPGWPNSIQTCDNLRGSHITLKFSLCAQYYQYFENDIICIFQHIYKHTRP